MSQGESRAYVQPEVSNDGTWGAVAGTELERLLQNEFGEDNQAKASVRIPALSILSKSTSPNRLGQTRTGLVCGHIQSGKTLSFTAVGAAAHDNNFRLIIVITGRTTILAEQSRDRLLHDLGVGEHPFRPWYHRHNPSATLRPTLRQLLGAWNTDTGRKQTILLTVLKHQKRIHNVADLLLPLGDNLLGPTLIIDDEADQASLNNRVRKGETSSVYRSISSLRDALPTHTYLQYTATPQANIFIPLIDLLSPDFCEVLDTGSGYVGGHQIFNQRGGDLVELIPGNELPDQHAETNPPPSLLRALRLFLTGVACGLIEVDQTGQLLPRNRSMLVHPSRLVSSHSLYSTWVGQVLHQWLELLCNRNDPDHAALVGEFQPAYDDLLQTVGTEQMPEFDSIVRKLPEAIRETEVREVNSADVDQMNWNDEWRQRYAWVLVGGQKLDRGFTVEGLTVTYMPRGRGVGYADTIQQRGRFFGYKAKYINFCRVFLETDVRDAFQVYVESEESMRDFLRSVSSLGEIRDPALKRRFQMDRSLRPTRRSVLLDNPQHRDFRSGWFEQAHPHARLEVSQQNLTLVNQFATEQGLDRNEASGQTDWLVVPDRARNTHLHEVSSEVSLRILHEDLLTKLLMSQANDDSQWQIALAIVEHAVDRLGDEPSHIVWMRPSEEAHRGTTDRGAIRQTLMGAYPNRRPYVYMGDRHVHMGKATLQVHCFDIHEGRVDSGPLRWRRVPTIALWLDDDIRTTLIVQEQAVT